jgi:hypothetical protein
MIYFNDWQESGQDGMLSDFNIGAEALEGAEVLFASYSYECYEGSAMVIFRKDGKLYEVNGGHCSCYGLEGQWEPEETTAESLSFRMAEGNLAHYCGGADEMRELIAKLVATPTHPETQG